MNFTHTVTYARIHARTQTYTHAQTHTHTHTHTRVRFLCQNTEEAEVGIEEGENSGPKYINQRNCIKIVFIVVRINDRFTNSPVKAFIDRCFVVSY